MNHSHPNEQAPELRVREWIDADGNLRSQPLKLADLGPGYKVIFSFQHWCPGCHSHGFPTLRLLHDGLKDAGVGFAVIQTVFEGAEVNTFDKLRVEQVKYDLPVPFGQDVPPDGAELPTFMADYRTGGTPWFTVIDPEGQIVYAGFQLDAPRLIEILTTAGSD